MDCSLKLITPPSVEPVTAADVKLHAHISHDVEDQLIELWISAARSLAEDFQRRAYIGQKWEIAFDGFPCMPIYIPRPPLISVDSIKCYDILGSETVLYSIADDPLTTTVEPGANAATNSDFIIDTNSQPGRIDFAYGKTWPSITPRSMNALIIRFTAGYGLTAAAVPQAVKDAIMLYCTYRSENRAGETEEAPKQFYNLLWPQRNFQ
jgi:uncharacterized phiE125 gp8 family phage protein